MHGKPRLPPVTDFGGQSIVRLMAGNEDHIGLDDFGAHRIGFASGGRELHGRMATEAVLDLARTDTIAGRRDDIVVAADEEI